MRPDPGDCAVASAVKQKEAAKGSRAGTARAGQSWARRTRVTPDFAQFVAGLDMFYLGTASADGQPYIQYRGGPPGFLKVLDDRTLGFADFDGNRQYITVGNLAENPRAFLFLMDYANSRRIKVWGTAKAVADDTTLLERLRDANYSGRVERAIVFTVEAWDINCPRHIHKRYSRREIAPVITELQNRIAELEDLREGSATRTRTGARGVGSTAP